MLKSDLIKIFQLLTEEDLRGLKKFVKSPLHNHRKDVKYLYEYLYNWRKKDAKKYSLDRVRVYEYLYPKEDFDDAKLKHTMSYLLTGIRNYLINSELDKDQNAKQIYLSKAIRVRGKNSDEIFLKTWKRGISRLENDQLRTANFYYDKFLFEQEYYAFQKNSIRLAKMDLQNISNTLSLFFIAEILKQGCSILSQKNVSPTRNDYLEDYHSEILLEAIKLIKKDTNKYEKHPAIGVYFHGYLAYKLILENEEESKGDILSDNNDDVFHFQKFNRIRLENKYHFPLSELRDIHTLALNYCIYKYRQELDITYLQAIFNLYEEGLTEGILLDDKGVLSPSNYKNALTAGLLLKQKEKTLTLLLKFEKKLDPEIRDYHRAILFFRTESYEKAMEILVYLMDKNKRRLTDYYDNLTARSMLSICFYELELVDELESSLDNFIAYIERHKKHIGNHKVNYLTFINYLTKLTQFRFYKNLWETSERLFAMNELLESIKSPTAFAEKGWLQGRITELIENN